LTSKNVIVGTAGHIDHGKTELIKALTGIDTDRLKEEKERGITIDIGFAEMRIGDELLIAFVDVPGHERFVKNMLAGAGGIDMVLLVVAADESIKPQTREHFDICRLLNIRKGVIAITKADLVEDDILELVSMEVSDFAKGSFLQDAPIIATSVKSGQGLEEIKNALANAAGQIMPKDSSGLFRLPIDRRFSMKGFGTVITGTLVSGTLEQDKEVEIVPKGLKTKVRGLQVFNKKTDKALAGQRTAVNLQGVELSQIDRGDVLVPIDTFRTSYLFDVKLQLLPSCPRTLKEFARVRFHQGTTEIMARVHFLQDQLLKPGEETFAQLVLEEKTLCLPGDKYIIRSYSPVTTIGGGVILDNLPQRHRGRKASIVERLKILDKGEIETSIIAFVDDAGAGGIEGKELIAHLGIEPKILNELAKKLEEEDRIKIVSRQPLKLISLSLFRALCDKVLQEIKNYHQHNPFKKGMPKEELRAKIFKHKNQGMTDFVLGSLRAEGKISILRENITLAGYKIELSQEEEGIKIELEKIFMQGKFTPPEREDALSRCKGDRKKVETIFKLLIDQSVLIKISSNYVIHSTVLEELKKKLKDFATKKEKINVPEFKGLTNTTRKYAIPLLEYLDRQKITRRAGDERIIIDA
jgi:selenocysteine-specific elongation factor